LFYLIGLHARRRMGLYCDELKIVESDRRPLMTGEYFEIGKIIVQARLAGWLNQTRCLNPYHNGQ
jgi:hypothetical protein